MSDLNQIHAALERLLNEEGQRIVFWNDPEQEFGFYLYLYDFYSEYVHVSNGYKGMGLDENGAVIFRQMRHPDGLRMIMRSVFNSMLYLSWYLIPFFFDKNQFDEFLNSLRKVLIPAKDELDEMLKDLPEWNPSH